MVLYSGLWKANNRYDRDEPRRETNTSRPTSIIGGHRRQRSMPDPVPEQKEKLYFENPVVGSVDDDEENKPLSQPSSHGSSRGSQRSFRPTYIKSVLFGGLWARSNERRHRHNHSDDGTSLSSSEPPQRYGAVPSFTNIEDGGESNKNEEETTQQNEEDGEDDFPSLTTVFNPDDIDWAVLRMCLIYLTTYTTVAIIAYCFVFEHWTVIDALYFAVSTFTTVGMYQGIGPSSR
eukprot:scaffold17318_cov169-Amphora_coffeaeformis.AAC.6